MNPAAALLVPFLMLMPAIVAGTDSPAARVGAPAARVGTPSGPISRPPLDGVDPWASMATGYRPQTGGQVRIEQHLTIRIGPRPAPMPLPPSMFGNDFDSGGGRFSERKVGKCVSVAGILGVQPAPGNRLLLIMRDERLITASLHKGCSSRDFYSGFIVAKNGDGMICTGRDQLLSRSGANCQVSGFRQLVQFDN
ncbi:MAG: hypothetical protein RLZZ84_839 [Pseudomonadota bacterium]|jgi:hypothetical protein